MEKLPTSEYSERKRDGELPTRRKPERAQKTFVDIDYPKALDVEYYKSHRDKHPYQSRDWYVWGAFYKYAQAVRDFYCAVMAIFNKTIYSPITLPEYITATTNLKGDDLATNLIMLKPLAQNVANAENGLLDCLDRNNTSITARCNKHKTLNELREYAAKAWLVCDNLEIDNFFHAVVDFKSRNLNKDMSLDRDVSLVTMGHYKAKNFVRTKVKDYFNTKAVRTPFKERHGRTVRIYENLNANQMFLDLMQMFNGYVYQENEEEILALESTVTEALPKKIIEFYKHYADVKNVYKTLLYKYKEHQNGYSIYDYTDEDYLISTGVRRNLFEVAVEYFNQLKEIFDLAENKPEYQFVFKDVHLLNKLAQAIEHHTDIYENIEEHRRQAIKNMGAKHN